MSSNRTARILAELKRRNVHVRQFVSQGYFELWADGQFQSSWMRPIDVECAMRKLLGVSIDDGVDAEREVDRLAKIARA